jgi:hypothetical protein
MSEPPYSPRRALGRRAGSSQNKPGRLFWPHPCLSAFRSLRPGQRQPLTSPVIPVTCQLAWGLSVQGWVSRSLSFFCDSTQSGCHCCLWSQQCSSSSSMAPKDPCAEPCSDAVWPMGEPCGSLPALPQSPPTTHWPWILHQTVLV